MFERERERERERKEVLEISTVNLQMDTVTLKMLICYDDIKRTPFVCCVSFSLFFCILSILDFTTLCPGKVKGMRDDFGDSFCRTV